MLLLLLSCYSWIQWDGNTLSNRERSLLVQGQMAILETVLFSFIPLPQDTAEKYWYIAWVQVGFRHHCRHSKADLVMLLPSFPNTLLATGLSWALLLWISQLCAVTTAFLSKAADVSWDQSHLCHKSFGFTEVGLQLHSSQGSGPRLLLCIAICSTIIVSCKVKNKYAA